MANIEPAADPNDDYVKFEVMDRASSAQAILDTLLGDHPGLVNGNLTALYDRAQGALYDLYQEAARISMP